MRPEFVLLMLASLSPGTEAFAAIIASESFESYTSNSQVHGLNGGSGWTAPWNVPVADRRPEVAVVNSYLSYYSGDIAVDGGSQTLQYAASEGDIAVLVGRAFPAQATAGPLYLSFLYQNSVDAGGTTASANDFVQVGFDTGSATTNNPRVSALDRSTTFQVRSTTAAANSVETGITSTAGQTFFIVLRAEKTGGSLTYNDIRLFVDPVSGTEGANPFTQTTVDSGLNLSTSAAFVIRKAFQDAGDTYRIDEIRVTDTFAEAVPTPEPSTYLVFTGLILCFGLAGWWKQRKRA